MKKWIFTENKNLGLGQTRNIKTILSCQGVTFLITNAITKAGIIVINNPSGIFNLRIAISIKIV